MKYRPAVLTLLFLSAMPSASPVLAQSVDTGILGTVSDSSGAVIPGSDYHHHERGDGCRPDGRQRPDRRVRGPLSAAGGLHGSGRIVRLPQRTCDGHDSRRADGEAHLRAAGWKYRRGRRRRSARPAARNAERRHRQRCQRCDAREHAAVGPELHDTRQPHRWRRRVRNTVPRERRARHVSAGLLRRRERAQQPRQQPVHVSVG